MTTILVATATGLRSFDPEGGEAAVQLEGRRVRALAPETWTRIWAAVDDREIWRRDGEWAQVATLDGLPGAEGLEIHCLADTRANPLGGILAGTSKARLVRVTEKAEIEFVDGFDAAPGRDGWYTPWGGPPDTRTISEDGESVYVNVHVGGVLRSGDEGGSWRPTIDVGADVHQIATGAGRVYAAGARGLSISLDGGESWQLHSAGLHARYCRAVVVCGRHLLVSASEGPGQGRAALYRSDLDGTGFERCSDWFRGNIDSGCADALPDGEAAVFASPDGDLYFSADEGASWARIATGLGTVAAVRVVP